VGELYLELPEGEALRGEHLRRLPLDLIEAVANEDSGREVERAMGFPAVQLGVLASYFAQQSPRTDRPKGGTRADRHPVREHWIDEWFLAEFGHPGTMKPPRARARRRAA